MNLKIVTTQHGTTIIDKKGVFIDADIESIKWELGTEEKPKVTIVFTNVDLEVADEKSKK